MAGRTTVRAWLPVAAALLLIVVLTATAAGKSGADLLLKLEALAKQLAANVASTSRGATAR
jgi:hypothetical protein